MIRPVRRSRRLTFALLLSLPALSAVLGAARVTAQPLPDRRPLLGHVTGFKGSPLGGAVITIRRTNESPTAYWGVRMLTNALGEFTVPNAEDGDYYISVTDTTGYADVNNQAYTLSSTGGAFNLAMQKLSSLRVRVIQSDGTPLRNGQVTMRLRLSSADNTTRDNRAARAMRQATDGNGDFVIPSLTPDTYSVEVLATGQGWGSLNGIGVTPNSDAPNEVRLQKGGAIHVKITEPQADGTKRPVGGAIVFVTQAPSDDAQTRAQGVLAPAPDGDAMTLLTVRYDRSGLVSREGDGMLDLTDLAPGRYQIRPFFPGYSTPSDLKAVEVKSGSEESIDVSLTPQPNTKFVPLTVVLKDAAGKPVPDTDWIVQMRFMPDGMAEGDVPPPPGAPGMGFGDGMPSNNVRRAHSDADGKIVLYPIKSGMWRMTVKSAPSAKATYEFAGRNFRAIPDMAAVTLQAGQ